MTLATTVTHYTPEDLLTLPDYGRYELIDGQLVARKMGTKSSYAATKLLLRFGSFVESNNLGLVFQADCGYQIFAEEPGRVRFADGSFSSQHPHSHAARLCETSPSLTRIRSEHDTRHGAGTRPTASISSQPAFCVKTFTAFTGSAVGEKLTDNHPGHSVVSVPVQTVV